MRFGRLRLPRGDRRRIQAVSDAGDDAANNEVSERERRRLERRAHDHDCRAGEDGPASAEHVSEPDADDGAHETSQVVRSHRNACVSLLDFVPLTDLD